MRPQSIVTAVLAVAIVALLAALNGGELGNPAVIAVLAVMLVLGLAVAALVSRRSRTLELVVACLMGLALGISLTVSILEPGHALALAPVGFVIAGFGVLLGGRSRAVAGAGR